MSDPLASVIEGILDGLIEGGAHLLDPEQRKAAVRDAVHAQRAQWAAIDPRTASQLVAEAAARHRVPELHDATRPTDPAPPGEDDGS